MVRRSPAAILPSLVLALSAAACASTPPTSASPLQTALPAARPAPTITQPVRASAPVPNPPERRGSTSAVQRALGTYKIGRPYQVAGVWYVPAEQPDYDAVGTASWYGDAFHGRPTANGEAFDMTLASAAHATLPLPSIVEVTNLENDRSVRLRVNDRGPFKPGRIIDVSRHAADQLGFREKGVARVRVRYVGPAPLDPFLPGLEAPQVVLTASAASDFLAAPRVTTPKSETGVALPAPRAIVANAETRFAVQAGAFANRGNAERAAAALGAIAPVRVSEHARDGSVLYRVLVGAWSAREPAASAVAAVADAGYPNARVVAGS